MTTSSADILSMDEMDIKAGLQNTIAVFDELPTGIYHGVSAEDYHKSTALSNSRLNALRRSPAHLKHSLEFTRPDTEALLIGRALHMLCLEPDSFDQNFYGMPRIDLRTKEGKLSKEALERAHPGKTGIKYEAFKDFPAIARNVRTDSVAKHFLSDLKPEVSIFFERDGVKCKARLDAWNEKLGCIVDIKTTENASRRVFEKSIFNYGYYRQAAWYLQAARTQGLDAKHFVIIAVEKKAPFLTAVYRLKDDVIELAQKEINELMKLYIDCEKADHWPGYSEGVEDIGIPVWGVTETNDYIEGE